MKKINKIKNSLPLNLQNGFVKIEESGKSDMKFVENERIKSKGVRPINFYKPISKIISFDRIK